ncbi:MAG: hypothetical protein U0263_30295 [Polyangiaceae bacterium]
MSKRFLDRRWLPGLALALGMAVVPARAERVDPTLPTRRVVGAPAGQSPMFRGDSARTGRTRQPLPSEPVVLWRARVTGGLDLPLVVDGRGHTIAASPMSQLVELDDKGKLSFSVKTGSSPPVQGPVLTTDGTRIVLTAVGELWGLTPNGAVRFRRTLPQSSALGGAQPLATRDGGAVFWAGQSLYWIDPSGDVQARAKHTATPVTLLELGGRILAVSERGDVYEWKPPEEPTKLGSFGGRIDEGAALSSSNHVTAVVDHTRVIDLKLSAGSRHIRVETSELLQGPPTILSNGETRVASFAGLLLGHDRLGAETTRAALEPNSGASAGSVPGLTQPPPLLVDEKGRVAFVRPELDAGVVLETGEIKSAAGAACGDPISLTAAGKQRFVVACRSGLILMIGAAPVSGKAR